MRGTWRPLTVMRRVGQASRWVESQTRPRVIAMFCGEKTMTVKRTILSAMMFVFASPRLVTTNSYPWQINEVNPTRHRIADSASCRIPKNQNRIRNIFRLASASSDEREGCACSLTRWQAGGEPGGTRCCYWYIGYRDQGSSTMCQRNHLAESRVPLLQKEFHRHIFQLHEWI